MFEKLCLEMALIILLNINEGMQLLCGEAQVHEEAPIHSLKQKLFM